jgi:general stress protein 26
LPIAPDENWQHMTEQNHTSRVWDVIENAGVCMLTTRCGGRLRARPMEARPDRDTGIIWFLTDVRGAKDNEIEAEHEIGLVFLDPAARAYLSISGRASVTCDTAQAKAIWKKTDDAWWPEGPRDPNVRVLRVEPTTAELWDGPANAAVVAFEFSKARRTGEKPNLGENRKTTVHMD